MVDPEEAAAWPAPKPSARVTRRPDATRTALSVASAGTPAAAPVVALDDGII
ncbi:hypothetical protein ACFSTC_26465 [Nonomuraea ferruginea]